MWLLGERELGCHTIIIKLQISQEISFVLCGVMISALVQRILISKLDSDF